MDKIAILLSKKAPSYSVNAEMIVRCASEGLRRTRLLDGML